MAAVCGNRSTAGKALMPTCAEDRWRRECLATVHVRPSPMDACGLDAIVRIDLGILRLDRPSVPVPSGFVGDPTTPEHVSARNA